MRTPEQHEERSEKAADALRTLLATLATGGNALVYAARPHTTSRWLWIAAAVAFGVSLACVICSWFMVKHRAIKRRDKAAGKDDVDTNFPMTSRKASWYWDTRAAGALFVGLALLAVAVGFFQATPSP